MEEESRFLNKKVVSGVVLFILLVSLPFAYYLVTKTQIFKPKASSYDIEVTPATGVTTTQENGQPVIETSNPDIELKLISPLERQQGTDAGYSVIKSVFAADNRENYHYEGATCRDNKVLSKSNTGFPCGIDRECRLWEQDGKKGAECVAKSQLPPAATVPTEYKARYGRCIDVNTVQATNGEKFDCRQIRDSQEREMQCSAWNYGSVYSGAECVENKNGVTQPAQPSEPQQPSVSNKTLRWFCNSNVVVREDLDRADPSLAAKINVNIKTCSGGDLCQRVDPVLINGVSVPKVDCLPGLVEYHDQGCQIDATTLGIASWNIEQNKLGECRAIVVTNPVGASRAAGTADNTRPVGQVCGKQCVYSQGDTCYSGNCRDGSQNCGFNDNCGWVSGCSSGAAVACPQTSPGQGANQGGAVSVERNVLYDTIQICTGDRKNWGEIDNELRTAGYGGAYSHDGSELDGYNELVCPTHPKTCMDNPYGAERPDGYRWVADCKSTCEYDSQNDFIDDASSLKCPKNLSDVNVRQSNSGFCFPFEDNGQFHKSCLMLWSEKEIASRSAGARTAAPASPARPVQPAPARPVTQPATPAGQPVPANPRTPPVVAPATPAQPVNPPPVQSGNNTNRRTTYYRVTADPSRFNDWDTYLAGGVKLPYGFHTSQPGKVVFLYVQFKDNLGNIVNANPYPIKIKYIAATGSPISPPAAPVVANPSGDSPLPACRTTTICGQSVTGDSCTQVCDGTRAKYDCKQNDNPNCIGSVYCNTVDNKCGGGTGNTVVASCKSDCNLCAKQTPDKCGNTTYDTCDYSTCTSASATYRCYAGGASGNSNCEGVHPCGSICGGGSGSGNGSQTGSGSTTKPVEQFEP